MNDKRAADAFMALGHEVRVSVLRQLVQAGRSGLNVGEIGKRLDIPASTLAFHLSQLVNAKLVKQQKLGREVRNFADFAQVETLSEFFIRVCCLDDPSKIGRPLSITAQNTETANVDS
jgi:ArsR family transcriptional regulator